jgi:hypothetical protein
MPKIPDGFKIAKSNHIIKQGDKYLLSGRDYWQDCDGSIGKTVRYFQDNYKCFEIEYFLTKDEQEKPRFLSDKPFPHGF